MGVGRLAASHYTKGADGMSKKTVTVTLHDDDFYFIMNSIALNVPSDEEKTPQELKTTNKLRRAEDRLWSKEPE